MAEAVARDMVDGIEVSSAGIHGLEDSPASEHAITALAEMGVDGSAHVARRLTPALLAAADHIYVMTEDQRILLSVWPGATAVELLDPDDHDIDDPYGGSLDDYRRTLSEVSAAVEARAATWI
jgi:protein-tyrosine phosphatase